MDDISLIVKEIPTLWCLAGSYGWNYLKYILN